MSELSFYDLTYDGPVVQAILDTAQKLRTEGYIFMGAGTPETVPGTPTERVWYLCGPGTYANFGTSVTVPEGSVMVAQYASGWTTTVIEIGSAGGGTFATGEEVGDVSLFDELSDLENKTDAQKALMLPNGKAVGEVMDALVNGAELVTTFDRSLFTENGYINKNGVLTSYSGWVATPLLTLPQNYDVLKFTGFNYLPSSTFIYCALYDANQTYCGYLTNARLFSRTEIDIYGAKYVRMCCQTSTTNIKLEAFTYVGEKPSVDVKIDNGCVIQNKVITYDGTITTATNMRVSNYLKLPAGIDKITFSNVANGPNYPIAYLYAYDDDTQTYTNIIPLMGGALEGDNVYLQQATHIRVSDARVVSIGLTMNEDVVSLVVGNETVETISVKGLQPAVKFEYGCLKIAGGYDAKTSYRHSDIMPLNGATQLVFSASTHFHSTYCWVQLFDAAQNQIGYINDDGTYDLTSAAYKDARYYRISTNNNLTNPSLTFTYPKYAIGLVGQIVGEMGVGDTINMAKGKRAFFWGDSITAGSYGGGYIGKVQNMLGLLTAINYGLNGRNTAGLKTAMIDNNIDYTTCDILTIMIGANDAYNGIINADEASAGDEYKDMPDIALSDISSYPYTYTSAYTTITSATLNNESEYFTKLFASTYIGNLSACIEYVQWKNPNCRIFLVTEYQTGYGANGYSGMRTSRVGIIKVGQRYGIPVIDVMSNCGINEKTAHIYLNSNDKLHPTTEGNKVLADFIGREILLNFNNV